MKKSYVLLMAIMAFVWVSCNQKEAQQVASEEVTEVDTYTAATPQANDNMTTEDFVAYLENCGFFFVATVDVDQPKLRPFSYVAFVDGEVYFMTRKPKNVYKQLVKNPKVQIGAINGSMEWMRVTCKLVEDDSPKVRTAFLDKYPSMKESNAIDDPDYAFMKLTGITAEIGEKVYSVKN